MKFCDVGRSSFFLFSSTSAAHEAYRAPQVIWSCRKPSLPFAVGGTVKKRTSDAGRKVGCTQRYGELCQLAAVLIMCL